MADGPKDGGNAKPERIESQSGLIDKGLRMATKPLAHIGWKSGGSAFAGDPGAQILPGGTFRRILVLERKRSERSGDPFLLVCLRVSDLQGETGQLDPVVRDTVFACLGASLRETDIIGWHRQEEIAAAILTELGETPVDRICQVVTDKINQCFAESMPKDIFKRIQLNVFFFPERSLQELPDHVREVLYPDLGRDGDDSMTARIKRTIDVIGSLAAIVFLSPLLLVIAALIKLTSRGPVLFRQQRLGQYGKPFEFLKFRSMYTNTDSSIHERYIQEFIKEGKSNGTAETGRPIFKIVEDPRVTPIGRILRKASLDELPQFFNVLRGEMSLVGPRPPIPYEIKQYDIWHRRRILEMKPGITGLWQVYGRSRTTFDEMVRMDLHYARNWSLAMDLRLLIMTPVAVFRGDGAC